MKQTRQKSHGTRQSVNWKNAKSTFGGRAKASTRNYAKRNASIAFRNASIAFRFFLVAVFALISLGLYSRYSNSNAITLGSFIDQPEASESKVDPFSLSDTDTGFALLAVSSDGRIVSYASDMSTTDTAAYIIEHFRVSGWHHGAEVTHASRGVAPSTTAFQPAASFYRSNDAFALILERCDEMQNHTTRMMIQFFPLPDGCSVVIEIM